MKRLLGILLFAATAATASADTFSFTVVGMDCAACGPPIVKTLSAIDGVKSAKVDWKEVVKTLDIVEYKDGRRVDVAKLLAPGKITIVDFYGEWCGPCRVLEVRLQHLMRGQSNLALRRVDIGKWDNEAARQATREFHAEALPYIRVYDGSGKFVAAVTGGMWDEVLAAIQKAER
jgi:thiol:disulfide interchange protein